MISIIIPHRKGESCDITMKTLKTQNYKGLYEIIPVEDTEGRGAPWARNRGAEKALGEYLLFSDCDIHWYSDALATLLAWLEVNPECSYSYGAYSMGGKMFCNREFDENLLRQVNYISTMSLIRKEDFPGFDENLWRLQDWDLWLTLLAQGKKGVYCNRLIFITAVRDGITFGKNVISYEEAAKIVLRKHGLIKEEAANV